MNPIFKNFLSVIRRFKMAVTLNILGLSVAFAAFMVIMIQLKYDYGFGKCHQDYDRIFRIESSVPAFAITKAPLIPGMIAEAFFGSSPQIDLGALQTLAGRPLFFYTETETGAKDFFREKSTTVTPEFYKLFTFDFVEGAANGYIAAEDIFMPLSLARKLFGKESAVGRQIFLDDGTSRTVTAVYRDFPTNTVIGNHIFFTLPPDHDKNERSFNYTAFFRVNDASNAPQLVDNFFRTFDFSVFGQGASREDFEKMGFQMFLTPLTDIHFLSDIQVDHVSKVSKQTLMILFAIAIVIVVIAAINFTNFSTALTPMRIKSINTMRILGVRRNRIRLSLVSETVIVCMLSWLVSLLLLLLFDITPLARLVEADLSLAANPLIVGGSALAAWFTGFLAGMFPARYITSFAPALVLKGNFGLSPKGKKLRNTLIGIQFIASFALMIGASFMYLQNRFMQKSDLGYRTDNIITVGTNRIAGSRDAFANQIKTFSGVDDVTFGASFLSSADKYGTMNFRYRGEQVAPDFFPVHYSFLDVMGIKVTEGRSFRREDELLEQGAWIFNETARQQFGLELNTQIEGWFRADIIGFVPDIKFASFRVAVAPMGFYVAGSKFQYPHLQANNTYIKLHPGADIRAVLSHINATLAEFDPHFPFEVHFFDEVIKRQYQKETSLNSLISLFSLIAIFISVVGVFGLVVFDSECRRKEIGIRKILGASTMNIISMFNKAYFRILAICFVIAAPLAWYAVTRWLENFAYQTPMYWWVYLIAFVSVGMITAATVTFQNWRVASDDPVNAVKME